MLLMPIAPALAIALCTFGVGVLVGVLRVLRRGETTPGRAGAIAIVAVGSTGAFLLLTTTYPALLVNTVLQVLIPDAALPEGQVVPLDLPATAGSAAATLLGMVLGLALTWLLFRIVRRDRVVGLALLLLTLTVFVVLGVAGAFAALLAAPDIGSARR